MHPSSDPGPRDDLRAAVADAHAGYHAETLTHRDPDVLVDDVVTRATVSPHAIRAALFVVVPTVLLLLWLVLGYLASISSPDPLNDLVTGVLGLLVVVLYLTGVAAFFAPAKEPIGEFSRLLEGRGAAAPAVQEGLRRAAAARRWPAAVEPGTVGGVPVLLFRQRSERAMLLVQPYGDDLYVGWTMWRSRSSATLLAHFLRDTFGRFLPGPAFSAELRAAATRALRESVHSLAREGVAAAAHLGSAPPGPASGAFAAVREEPRGGEPLYRPTPSDDRRDDARADARADPRGALPRSAPATGGFSTGPDPREPVRERRGPDDEHGWGPPPRER